jgi:transposase
VPKQNSSDGKEKLGSITKQGDRYLRSLLCAGPLAVIRYAKIHGTKHRASLAKSWKGPTARNAEPVDPVIRTPEHRRMLAFRRT